MAHIRGELAYAERELQLGLRDAQTCRARTEATRLHFALARIHRSLAHHELAWTHTEQGRELAYSGGSPMEKCEANLMLGCLRVEADQEQVNLDRFPLFFPEKREFFIENSGTYAFGDLP